MTLLLDAATASDISVIVKIETEVFASDPPFHFLFPKGVTPVRLANLRDDYQEMFAHDTSAHQLKVTDSNTGDIVAVGRWHIYGQPRSESELERDKERIWSPDARSDEACQQFSDLLTEARKRVMGGKPHLCNSLFVDGSTKTKPVTVLKMLATIPECRGRGAASHILEWGFARADELGLPAYLEASDEGALLYGKRGFQKVGSFVTDLKYWGGEGLLEAPLMVRQPNGLVVDATT